MFRKIIENVCSLVFIKNPTVLTKVDFHILISKLKPHKLYKIAEKKIPPAVGLKY